MRMGFGFLTLEIFFAHVVSKYANFLGKKEVFT